MRSTRAPCICPPVGTALLERVRVGAATLEHAQLQHLLECKGCREDAVRAQRMRRAWSATEASPAEIADAHARFIASRRPRARRPWATSKLVAVTVVLVAAAASAAERIVTTHFTAALPAPRTVVPLPSATVSPEGGRKGPAGPRIPRAPEVDDVPTPPFPVPEEPAPAALPPAVRRVAVTSIPPALRPASVAAARPWADAVAAMRAGDLARAELAFGELTRSDEPHTRDAARLARAQVWSAQGRVAEARRELGQLAASAATATLREAASNVLAELSTRDSSRSP